MKYIVTSKAKGTKYLVDDSDTIANELVETIKSSGNFEVRQFQKDVDTEAIWELYLKQTNAGNR
jgi:hypothetical protein